MLDNYHSTRQYLIEAYPLLGQMMTVHRNTRGGPMSLTDKPALVELYTTLPKMDDVVLCKCVQNGVSELMVQYALLRAGWDGRICGYVLPTSAGRNRFVQTRIDPLLLSVPEYRARTPAGRKLAKTEKKRKKAAENLQLKEFGAGRLMFLGSNSAVDFLEFSADILIIDELDGCDPKNLSKARNRLRASPYPQLIRLGNPTLPTAGISRLYTESDQRVYHHVCTHCNERQPIDWFVNVVEKTKAGNWVPRDTRRWRGLQASQNPNPGPHHDLRPVCRRCRDPFDRGIRMGSWVSEFPDRNIAGYRMSRLDIMYPSQGLWPLFLEWVLAQGDTKALATFYCDVLGFAHSFSGMRLSVEDLHAAMVGDDIDYGGGDDLKSETVTMGVDVGSVLNVQISIVNKDDPERRDSIFVGAFRTFGEVQDAIQRYHVDVCVIDERPEIHKASEVRDWALRHTHCQVWLCRFQPTPRAGRDKFGVKLDFSTRVVAADRTSLCDVMVDDVKGGRQTFPADAMTCLHWGKQMRAPGRRLDEAKQRIIWDEGGKPDHYFFAANYDRLAFELLQRTGSFTKI